MLLTDAPSFTLALNMSDCAYELMLNGAYQHVDVRGLPLKTDLPVNQWILQGRNEIVLNVYADPSGRLSDQAFGEINLVVRKFNSPRAQAQTMAVLRYSSLMHKQGQAGAGSTAAGTYDSQQHFTESDTGDVKVSKVQYQSLPYADMEGISLKLTLDFSSSLPPWAFAGSKQLPDLRVMAESELAQIHASLYQQYNQIHAALKQGRMDDILDLFDERNLELEQAFHEVRGSRSSQLRQVLFESMWDVEQELVELNPEFLAMEMYPNRQLIHMVRANAAPAIIYNYPGQGLSRSFDLLFRFDGSDWILTR